MKHDSSLLPFYKFFLEVLTHLSAWLNDSSFCMTQSLHTKWLNNGIMLLNPLKVANSRSTPTFFSAFKFDFKERSSNANLLNVALYLVKCIITGPKNTGCFPRSGFINLFFLYDVSITQISQRLKVGSMANTEESLSRQQNFSISSICFSV